MKRRGFRTKATITVITALLAIGLMAGLYCLSAGKEEASTGLPGKQAEETASPGAARETSAAGEPAKAPEEKEAADRTGADRPEGEGGPAAEGGKISVYEQLETKLRENPEVKYEGFIVSLKETASREDLQKLDRAIAAGAPMAKLEYTEGAYTASSIDDIKAVIDESLIANIDPNVEEQLLLGDEAPGGDGEGPGDDGTGEDAASLCSAAEPDDAYYGSKQYNLEDMNVPGLWAEGLEGQDVDAGADMDFDGTADNDDVIVAVIDSGIDRSHEDLDQDRILPGTGFRMVTRTGPDGTKTDVIVSDGDVTDITGHGTFVSGIIAAKKDNGRGIAGMLQETRVKPIRVVDEKEKLYASVSAVAINYAARQRELFDGKDVEKGRFDLEPGKQGLNISVINLSYGGNILVREELNACRRAIDAGIIVVSAAGNDFQNKGAKPFYPAQCTLGVGSVGDAKKVSAFSQRLSEENQDGQEGSDYRNKVWVCAPGEKIQSLAAGKKQAGNGQYCNTSGTSFSCPEVAALAALCKGVDNTMDHERFKTLLKETAVPMSSGEGSVEGQDVAYGWGLVDVQRTVDRLYEEKSDPPQGTTDLTVTVKNAAGSLIPGARIVIRRTGQDGEAADEVAAGGDGKWTLAKGQRYSYSVSAEGYESQSGSFTPHRDSRILPVTLDGSANYPVTFVVRDRSGKQVSECPSVTVYRLPKEKEAASDGLSYALPAGRYSVRVPNASGWIVDGSDTFALDPEKEELSSGKRINLTLSRPSVSVTWENDGSTREVLFSSMLSDQVRKNMVMIDSGTGGKTSYSVNGITLRQLLRKNGGSGKCLDSATSITISGKRIKDGADIQDPDALTGDIFEDAGVTLTGKMLDKAMIALSEDPVTGRSDGPIRAGNHMRLAVDGAPGADWLYAPESISLRLAGHEWDGGIVTRQPTTSAAGVRTYTCIHCGQMKTETIPKLSESQPDGSDSGPAGGASGDGSGGSGAAGENGVPASGNGAPIGVPAGGKGGASSGGNGGTLLPAVGLVSGIEIAGNYRKKTFTLRFGPAPGATDYVLQWRKRSGKWMAKGTGGKTSATTGKLSAGGMYDVRILPCRRSDGACGKPSETKRLLMKETRVKKAKGGKKKFTVRWKKTAGATGYQILYSKNRSLKNAKIKTVGKKKRSCTVRGLKKGRWYVAVRPVKRSGGTYIGIPSKAKKVKVR